MGISEKISVLRKSNNMTQAELGTKLNVTFQAVSKWERGESYPDFDTLSKIAKIFGVPISYFEEGGEDIVDAATEAVATAVTLDGANRIVGFCKECGKLVHENEEACTTPVVICKQCAIRRENLKKIKENEQLAKKQQAELAVKAKKQAEVDRCKKRRNRGLIASAIITGALLLRGSTLPT